MFTFYEIVSQAEQFGEIKEIVFNGRIRYYGDGIKEVIDSFADCEIKSFSITRIDGAVSLAIKTKK